MPLAHELTNLGFAEMLNFPARKSHYHTLYLLSVFSLAKSLRQILVISATWLICRLCAQCMIFNNSINSSFLQRCICRYFLQNDVLKQKNNYYKVNNKGLGKCYQPRPSARMITLTSTLIIADITKTSSDN